MKKILLTWFLCVFLYIPLCPQAAPAPSVVFDPTNWLTALDTLYSTYDTVMNQIQMIQYQYEQIQHYIEQAKTWEFEDIEWDGDWDFRDEIKQATKSINRQLNNIRKIEESLTIKTLDIGGYSGTVAEFLNPYGDNNMINAIDDNYDWAKNKVWKDAVAGFEGTLTEKQKAALWRKYGLSTKNYYYVQAKKSQLNNAIDAAIAWSLPDNFQAEIEETSTHVNNVLSAGMDPNNTEKSLAQQTMLLTQLTIEELVQLQQDIKRVGGLMAWYMGVRMTEEEAQREEKDTMLKNRNTEPGSLFLSGTN